VNALLHNYAIQQSLIADELLKRGEPDPYETLLVKGVHYDAPGDVYCPKCGLKLIGGRCAVCEIRERSGSVYGSEGESDADWWNRLPPTPDGSIWTRERIVSAWVSVTGTPRPSTIDVDKLFEEHSVTDREWLSKAIEDYCRDDEYNALTYEDYKDAILGEGWADGDYKDMVSKADTPEEKAVLTHIMEEEQEHTDELLGLMKHRGIEPPFEFGAEDEKDWSSMSDYDIRASYNYYIKSELPKGLAREIIERGTFPDDMVEDAKKTLGDEEWFDAPFDDDYDPMDAVHSRSVRDAHEAWSSALGVEGKKDLFEDLGVPCNYSDEELESFREWEDLPVSLRGDLVDAYMELRIKAKDTKEYGSPVGMGAVVLGGLVLIGALLWWQNERNTNGG